jgi:hypothetical protein
MAPRPVERRSAQAESPFGANNERTAMSGHCS